MKIIETLFHVDAFEVIDVPLLVAFKELLFFDTNDLSFSITRIYLNQVTIIAKRVTLVSDNYDKNCTDTRNFGLI